MPKSITAFRVKAVLIAIANKNTNCSRYNMLTRTKIIRKRLEIPVEQVLEEKKKREEELQRQKEEAERKERERREKEKREREERLRKKREVTY